MSTSRTHAASAWKAISVCETLSIDHLDQGMARFKYWATPALTISSNREARDFAVRVKLTEASRVSGYQGVQISPESCYSFSRCVSNPWHPYWWPQPRRPLLLHQRLPQTCWPRMAFSILPSTRLSWLFKGRQEAVVCQMLQCGENGEFLLHKHSC